MYRYLIDAESGTIMLRSPAAVTAGPGQVMVESRDAYDPAKHRYDLAGQRFVEVPKAELVRKARERRGEASFEHDQAAYFADLWEQQPEDVRKMFEILLSVPDEDIRAAIRAKTKKGQ